MYKVGDEVLVKGKVVEVISAVPYPVKVKLGKDEDAYLFSNDEICFADKIFKTYESGLSDAWELAKKIVCEKDNGGMSSDECKEAFGNILFTRIFQNTYEEALAKIEAYEREKEIKVSDIVKVKGESGCGIVTAVCSGRAYILWKDGGCSDYELSELENTGKTAEGLDLLLRQIKG